MGSLRSLLEDARKLLPETVALRRRIHACPELGLELPLTQRAVLEALDGLGLEIETGGRTSAVVATLRGARPGPTILLRADMDALPLQEETGLDFASRTAGAMHACGHDAHVAMLAGAARLLAQRRRELAGSVRLVFQPGEEGQGGMHVLLQEGLLKRDPRPRAAFAIHVNPALPAGRVAARPGPLLASADVLSIEVEGRGGHASMPHHTRDPIPVACEIVLALQSLVTRRVDPFDPVVVTVARIDAGTTDNVIPASARLVGTIRSVSESARRAIHEGVRRVAAGVAAAHELEARVHVLEGYPVTVNDSGFVGFARRVASDLLGPDGWLEMGAPLMGAEDFSYLLQEVPGAMVFLGVQPADRRPEPLHSNRMVLDEDSLAVGIALHSAMALRWLAEAGA